MIDGWFDQLLQARDTALPPLQHLQPATRVQFGLGAVLQYSSTPSLRLAGFEDEDSLPDEAFGVQGDSSCG